MGHKYIYKTHFKFDNEVRSVHEANLFFTDECGEWPWFKESIADWIGEDETDKIIDFAWCVTHKDCGIIRVVTTEELSDQVLDALSKWIKHYIDTLEEDELHLHYKDVFWYTEGFEVQAHFDHEGSDYKLKLVKVE